VRERNEENVLVLSGDHIYLMDYRPLLKQHTESGADLTLGVRRVSPFEAHRYGIVTMGNDGKVESFEEKPKRTRESLASMGVYVFKKSVLVKLLEETKHLDFGRNLVPAMVAGDFQVQGYTFPGYWADMGNAQAYWEANMSLLAENPALDLYDADWWVLTRSMERAPVKVGANAKVDVNLLSNGCRVDGIVEHSVLSPGVYVAEGAVVRNSILLHDVVVEAGAVIDRAIIDKNCRIGSNALVGHGDDNTANQDLPEMLNTGLTIIGKDAVVPAKLEIGRNVVIHSGCGATDFGKKKKLASGVSLSPGVDYV
jgi:glucose-1-phosphate adenylyltransferase